MIKTVFFDLDGTLLPLDMEAFMNAYFQEVGRAFNSTMEPKVLINMIMKATEYMVGNLEPYKTNREVFEEELERLMGKDISTLMEKFLHFYATDFRNIRQIVSPEPICKKVVGTLVNKGYDVILATNPLFPRIAIEERVRWAGIETKVFKTITVFEEMHFCKPNLEYYKEIMEIINTEPECCLMVGNDVEEDMVAGQLGMKTFLLDKYLIKRNDNLPEIDYRGGYEELLDFVENCLPTLEEKSR